MNRLRFFKMIPKIQSPPPPIITLPHSHFLHPHCPYHPPTHLTFFQTIPFVTTFFNHSPPSPSHTYTFFYDPPPAPKPYTNTPYPSLPGILYQSALSAAQIQNLAEIRSVGFPLSSYKFRCLCRRQDSRHRRRDLTPKEISSEAL